MERDRLALGEMRPVLDTKLETPEQFYQWLLQNRDTGEARSCYDEALNHLQQCHERVAEMKATVARWQEEYEAITHTYRAVSESSGSLHHVCSQLLQQQVFIFRALTNVG